jgi:hypothetical protein
MAGNNAASTAHLTYDALPSSARSENEAHPPPSTGLESSADRSRPAHSAWQGIYDCT